MLLHYILVVVTCVFDCNSVIGADLFEANIFKTVSELQVFLSEA